MSYIPLTIMSKEGMNKVIWKNVLSNLDVVPRCINHREDGKVEVEFHNGVKAVMWVVNDRDKAENLYSMALLWNGEPFHEARASGKGDEIADEISRFSLIGRLNDVGGADNPIAAFNSTRREEIMARAAIRFQEDKDLTDREKLALAHKLKNEAGYE